MTGDANKARFERQLLDRLVELDAEDARAAGAEAPVALEQDSVGRLSRADALQQQAMALAARERRRLARDRVHAALRRLSAGDFGWCLSCGEDIGAARLANDPTVTLCLACAAARD